MVGDHQGQGVASGLQDQTPAEVAHLVVDVAGIVGDPLLLLEGRDLGIVDDIEDVDPVAVELDLAEAVDREVAQWVSEGRHGGGEG